MIFRNTWQQVLDGTKTQTRRLVWEKDVVVHQSPGYAELPIETVYKNGLGGQLRWAVGKTYAIQPGRGKKAVGRVRITSIRRERLQDISFNDMLCEGYPIALFSYTGNFDENPPVRDWFIAQWDSINTRLGTRWADNPEVWVLTFKLAEGREQ